MELKKARLSVGFLSFKESYVSDVTCVPYSEVEVSSNASPYRSRTEILGQAVASSGTPLFKTLVTTWRMKPAHPSSPHPTQGDLKVPTLLKLDDNVPTLLSVDLAFAFANPLYAAASSAFFKQVSAMMVKAFEERCVQVYGSGKK